MSRITSVVAIHVACALAAAAAEPAPAVRQITVEVVDTDGQPIEGADVGLCAMQGGTWSELASKDGTHWYYPQHARTGADGSAVIDDPRSLSRGWAIVARHEARHSAAFLPVDATKPAQTLQLVLEPETEISFTARCAPLTARGRQVLPMAMSIDVEGRRALIMRSETGQFRFFLPPGTHELAFDSHMHRTRWFTKRVVVKPGAAPIDLDTIDLQPAGVELLIGQAAPEIPDILGWKNGPAARLAELRGRVVLLDFFAFSCGNCLSDMPKLFALHDVHAKRGLTIIGVHIDRRDEAERIDTAAKLDTELADTRQSQWNGRDFPFAVALVGGPAALSASGKIEAREEEDTISPGYGITVLGTQVLIDRRGIVADVYVGGVHSHPGATKRIEELLAEEE